MRKNTKVAEIILIIAVILFAILVAFNMKTLKVLSDGMADTAVETTTVIGE